MPGSGAKDAAGARTELITQIGLAEQRVRDSRTRATQLNAEIEQIERERLGDAHLPSEPDLIWSGQVSVIGPGIVLTINDNPKDANGTLVDQDLRQVANGLWLAGRSDQYQRSSAQRSDRDPASRCRDHSRLPLPDHPYRIEAIGDPGALEVRLHRQLRWCVAELPAPQLRGELGDRAAQEVRLGPDAGLAVGHAGVA